MKNIKDLYIIGEPIETEIGSLRFIKVKEYPKLLEYLYFLTLDKNQLLRQFIEISKVEKDVIIIYDLLKQITLFEFLKILEKNQMQYFGLNYLYQGFVDLFQFCFNEDVFYKIKTSEEFEYYRDLIVEINCIPYEKPNPNPEIARFDRLKKMLQQAKGEIVTFEAMYTSVLLFSSVHPNEMTLYQFHKAFDRISHFKNYERTTLCSIVNNEVKVIPWYAETQKETPSVITEEQLNRAKAQIKGLQQDL